MDLTDTIIPKSDQINADDLITGPRTFTIKGVRRGSDEQPVNIDLVELPGRPFRPSKTVTRILVAAWGKESDAYTGRRMTLYRDPDVKFGGQDVGGIRVSHLSDIAKPLNLALTATRGKKSKYVVQPLPAEQRTAAAPANPDAITAEKVTELGNAMTNGLELTDRDAKLAWLTQQLERPVKSPTELSRAEGDRLIALIKEWTEPPADEPADGGPSEADPR